MVYGDIGNALLDGNIGCGTGIYNLVVHNLGNIFVVGYTESDLGGWFTYNCYTQGG